MDFLAVQFHVDFYDLAASLQMKRDAVKNSILWHMKKGTSWAIIQALKMIGVDGEFLHWKDYGGEPYSFRIRAKITGDYYRTSGRDKIISAIRKAVNESKAARSYFEGLDTEIFFNEDINLYVATKPLLSGQEIIRLAKYDMDANNILFAANAAALQGNKKIFPARIRLIENNSYAGIISINNISHDLGLDLNTMHELLLQFEKRIFDRIEQFENNVTLKIQAQNEEIQSRFDEVIALLEWKGDDEEISN